MFIGLDQEINAYSALGHSKVTGFKHPISEA